jgi:hypothetical protein
MLDEGKITQREYDMVKAELLDAPAEDWDELAPSRGEEEDLTGESGPAPGWRAFLADIPPIYRAAAVGALVVLVTGVLLAANGDSAGSVRADPSAIRAASPAGPAADSLGVLLADVTEAWNEVGDPPSIDGGIMTSPEPGRLDSFLYRFEGTAVLAGAYDPDDGSVHAVMARAALHDDAAGSLFIHLCHLLHPGSQECLDAFVEVTGTFGKPHSELAGMQAELGWDLEGQAWELEIANDVETIRVQSTSGG